MLEEPAASSQCRLSGKNEVLNLNPSIEAARAGKVGKT